MKLTENEIDKIKFYGLSPYSNTFIERYRTQLVTREIDKLHGFFEIEIKKYSKKYNNCKSSFFKFDSSTELLQILKNNLGKNITLK